MRINWIPALMAVLLLAAACGAKENTGSASQESQAASLSREAGSAESEASVAESRGSEESTRSEAESARDPDSEDSVSSEEEPQSGYNSEVEATPPGQEETEPEPARSIPLIAPAAEESDALLVEAELLRLINQEREQNGAEPLGREDCMWFAARIRAEEALESLSHTRPDGTPYHTAFDEAGFDYAGKWHGENLAIISVSQAGYDAGEVASAIFQQYKNSPGHHSNMLSENFCQTGVGVYREQDGATVLFGTAQLFAGL